MSFIPTIASHWSNSQPGAGGALCVPGNKSVIGGVRVDKPILTVDAAGDLRPNNPSKVFSVGTDVDVLILADTGPIDILYGQAHSGASIPRGSILTLDSFTVPGQVRFVEAGAGDIAVGVALFNLDDLAYVWVACSGVIPCLTNAAVTEGDLLAPGAGGTLVAAASAADATHIAYQTTGAGGIALCRALPRGL